MSARTLTGAMMVCYINGKLYGKVSAFNWDSQTVHKAIYGLDNADPFELASGTTKVAGSMSVYRLSGDAGAQGAGIAVRYEDIPRGKYFNIVILDRKTDLVIFQARNCVLQAESWGVNSKGTLNGSMRFEAIDWVNELKDA